MSTIKGYLGELIVKPKLLEEGLTTISLGNQSGYDLEYNDIKIDVKLSCLKNEFKLDNNYWGWALKHQNKKKDIKATHLICVALTETYDVNAFYVISANNINGFPQGIKQFSKVEHGFGVYLSDPSEIKDEDIRLFFDNSMKLLHNNVFVIKVNETGSLRNAIEQLSLEKNA
ncbi:MAG: hypothetical protein FJ126_10555 [Deltaproteobacteria bacterium]|nr:hypothetical protein [Deltaproteobacteria bacterium]